MDLLLSIDSTCPYIIVNVGSSSRVGVGEGERGGEIARHIDIDFQFPFHLLLNERAQQ